MRFEFAGNQLDIERRELSSGGDRVEVEPQVFDLLVHLLRNRDRVISKDELMASVWAGRIVSDSTLATRINAARRAIGDTGEQQRLIRTYSRKGIRFVGDVRESDARIESSAESSPPEPATKRRRGKPCVAILPFANLSGDTGQDYFSDGVTEDLITELSRNRALDVVARNSTFAFRGSAHDVRQIGRELSADYVVEGSVRWSGRNLRVTVQLSETESGHQLWAERYDRGLQEIFDVQDEIASTIAARLEPEVGMAEQQRVARKAGRKLDAWDYFRLGTKSFYKASAEANLESQQLFRRAIELDPELAQAYGFLSYAIVLSMVYFDAEPNADRIAEALSIARKGMELDERDALVRFMYGRALIARGRYAEAVEELETAREMNPNLAAVHCGLGDSLACEGRVRDSIPHFEIAIAMSPHDPLRWAFFSYRALAHIFAGDFSEAAHWAGKAIRVPNCHYSAFAHQVVALAHLGRKEELDAAVAELLQRKPDFSQALAKRRLFYINDPAQLAAYVSGLRKAGLPVG